MGIAYKKFEKDSDKCPDQGLYPTIPLSGHSELDGRYQCCGSEIINFGSGSGSGSYFPVNFGSGSGSGSGSDFQIISDPDPTFYLFSDPNPFRILFGSNIFSNMKKKFTFFQVFSSSIVNSF